MASADALDAWFEHAIWRVGRGVQVLGTGTPRPVDADRYADMLRYVLRRAEATLQELHDRWLAQLSAGSESEEDDSVPVAQTERHAGRSEQACDKAPTADNKDAAVDQRVKDLLTDRVLAIGDACGFSSESTWDVVQNACTIYDKMINVVSGPNRRPDSFHGGLHEAQRAIESLLQRNEDGKPFGFRFDQKVRGRRDGDDDRVTVSELLCFLALVLAFAGTIVLMIVLDWQEPVAQNVLSEAIVGLATAVTGVGLRVVLHQWNRGVPWLRTEQPRQGLGHIIDPA